jgi:dipeptidyl aminopeptidase/acylaminoacyl peptidase
MVGTPGGAEAQEPGRLLSLERYLDFESVADAQISPDGSRIVYARRWVDKLNDRQESSIWIMDADGSRNRELVEGSSPRWSPDGTRIAFIAEGEPTGDQLWVRWMDEEGSTTQITRLDHGPSNIEWSPDGTSIAFSSLVEERSDFEIETRDLPGRSERANWTRGPKIVERASYKRDRRGYIDTGWTHAFVVPADGGTARQLTDGDWNHSAPRWSPDGRELYVSALRVGDDVPEPDRWYESEIYSVDLASGHVQQLTRRRGPDESPVPSPDGRLIAYTGVDWNRDTYRNRPIYVMERDGSNPRQISGDFDRQVRGMRWSADGSGVYFNAESEGAENVYFASLDGGVRAVTEGRHVLAMSSFSDDGIAVATVAGPHDPGDIYRFALTEPDARVRLTSVNDDVLHDVRLGEVEEIWYESTDGFRIQGWIVKPPGFDPGRKYPLMLSIHGGPHSMYDVGFRFAFQEHAANGYVVLYTNPRGSTGYGSVFANAIQHAYPGPDMDDLMAGVDEVLARGYVDETNLFVYGCSGGGILTTYIVGNTDRFTAASANCPIVNWMSAMGTSDAFSYTRTFDRFFWDDPDEWMKRSSIFYVGDATTPTMLMTGEMDLRTPMAQTEEFYQALKILGVPTVMVRFQEEWHGTTSRPSNFLRTQLYLRKWFEQWGTHDEAAPVADR